MKFRWLKLRREIRALPQHMPYLLRKTHPQRRLARLAAALLAAALGRGGGQASAQELMAWPIGTPGALRWALPGMPVRPLPLPPRPLPPRPLPIPNPRPIPTPMPPVAPPDSRPLELSGYRIEGKITDTVANLAFDINFHNPTNGRLEGVLLAPIPADTVLSGFQMTVGGKTMKAELLEAGQAATIYENIVRSMRDPGLLELVGDRLLRAKVFPIEPRSDIQVHIAWSQVLHKSGELYSLRLPLKSARMTGSTTGRPSVRLDLAAAKPIRTVYSPKPGVRIERISPTRVIVSYREEGAAADSDLPLFYSLEENPLAAGLLAYRPEGEDGTFLLSLAPKLQAEDKEVSPKDIVFVVDRSGSMEEGGKMNQAREALAYCIGRLGPRDRFGVVDFATDWSGFESSLVQATPANRARALRYVKALEAAGGTNIEAGLEQALAMLVPAAGRVPMVFFLTDGIPTVGQTSVDALLRRASERNSGLKARLFSFGVGDDVNTLLLDKLAEMNRGSRDYVAPGETIEAKLSTLYQKVAKPALTDVRVEWQGLDTAEVYPRRVSDLFFGGELTLMGRYKGGGKGTLVVTGSAAGKPVRFEYPVELPAAEGRNDFLPRLWANLKVASELDAIRLSGRADPEVVESIVRLAKRFGIVTPYTSFLITEEGQNMAAANQAAMREVRMLQADAAASGFSGGAAVARRAQRSSSFFAGAADGASLSAMAAPEAQMPPGTTSGPSAPRAKLAVVRGFEHMEKEARDELKAGGKAAVATRTAGGKTFYRRGEEWVDADYELREGLKTVAVRYLSPEYFDLLRRKPALRPFLALGSRLVVVSGGTAYRITE